MWRSVFLKSEQNEVNERVDARGRHVGIVKQVEVAVEKMRELRTCPNRQLKVKPRGGTASSASAEILLTQPLAYKA